MRSQSPRPRPIGAAALLSGRAGRAVLVAAVSAGLALTGAVAPAVAAPAATASPAVKVVAGDRMLTAAWSRVAGASGYTVRVGTDRALTKARTVSTTKRVVRLRGLKNGKAYFVRVVPVGARTTIASVGAKPRVVRAVATPGVPIPVSGVKAVSGPLENQVTVSWRGGGRASKLAVIAGSNVITDQRSFNSGWVAATTRSITITVPEALRPFLGAGSGNPVGGEVVQANSASKAFGAYYSYDRKYRPSPVGTWAFAKADVAPAAVTKLRVAELNIQSFGATAKYSKENRWSARAPRAAAYVNAAAPDVLTTAELATNLTVSCTNSEKYDPYRCAPHTQVADLARRLDTLKLAGTDAYARVMDQMRTYAKWNGRATDGAHVFYDPAKATLLDHGYFSPALAPSQSFKNVVGLGVSNWDGRNAIGPDRWVSWAKLRTVEGGREFFVVAAHLPVGDASAVVDARREEAQKLVAAIDAMAGTTPVVFGSDMNADSVRNPKAAHTVFMQDGWFDAAAVAKKSQRTNMKVSTANGSGPQDAGSDAGYGARPVRHPYETSRIDYILLKNSPYTFRYENVLRLNPDGTFKKDLQGTDHNMQLATIGIAGLATAG